MSNKAATPPPSLPFIDLSKTDLNPNSWEWEVLKSQVYLSLKDFGCFKARFPELQLKAAKAMIAELKQLFDLPLDIKLLNTSDMPFGGFIGQSTFAPLYQSFGIEDPFSLPKLQSLTHALLPDKPSLRLRFMKYDGININMNENEPKFGLNSHMDQDLMTVLYSNYAGELEILTKDGQYWISSQATSQDFIVFVGESLHAWTNGRLHCPYHRVKMTGREARYSVAVFTAFKGGYTVEAPEELVDEEHPLLYKPFDHLDFLNLMDRDAGKAYFGDQLNAYTPLKAYYGIFN
ncbi:Probable 2-oxoglutarate-dependent dioxygenase AOP1.2 [Linum grandiflorum]